MSETGNEIDTVATDAGASVASFNAGSNSVYSSIQGTSFDARKKVVQAITASEPIDEHKGKTIKLVNFVAHVVNLTNPTSGEIEPATRVVLIDDKDKAYHAVSMGIVSALRNITAILGDPHTWPGPLDIQVVEERTSKGFKVFTIKLV